MKLLRYLIFFFVLSIVFVKISYRSEIRSIKKWRISFRIALIYAAVTTGLISGNVENVKSEELLELKNNNLPVILIKNDGNPFNLLGSGARPSNFPTSDRPRYIQSRPTQPNRPALGRYQNPYSYRPLPKTVSHGHRGNGAGNGAKNNNGINKHATKNPPTSKEKTLETDYNKKKSQLNNVNLSS